MIANWKLLICGFVALASFVWLGPTRDSDADLTAGTEFAMNDASTCARHHSPRCMIDVRYAYPAADLYVVPEDFYF
jgi:hypothetical protein